MNADNAERPVIVKGPSAGVTTLVMNQPSTRNALTSSLVDALHAALAEARSDPETHCIVLASAHPRVFCAGGDLNTFTADTPLLDRHHGMDQVAALFGAIEHLGKPVIAAVNGHALAGGMGLILACDLVLASADATFGCPEITIGTFPFMVSAMLARAVGKFKASEILMMGNRL
jgi:enoyl-CoA hydratase/carnithine racemase